MTPTRRFLAAAALLLAMPFAALAQSNADAPPPDQDGKQHRGPPPEAVAACKGKAVGTQASFTDRAGRTVSGACTQMGDVVAVPPPHGPQGHEGPPPQQK
jgi:Spy/CpxP family protein refolding chaperone